MKIGRLSRPESLTEMAYRELRAAIVDGRLKLGDQVSEQRLSQLLGISKTPVREALLSLKRDGLVVIDPQRATSIFHIDASEIAAIRDFRQLLEVAAASVAFERDRGRLAGRIGAVVEAMAQALGAADRSAYRKLDAQFHDVIVEESENPYLVSAYALVATKVGALRTRAQDSDMVVRNSLRTHRRLHELIQEGEIEPFCDLLRLHIDNTGSDYMKWLAAQDEG